MFEANLNGSGLVIRVLKDTHRVESIEEGTKRCSTSDRSDSSENSIQKVKHFSSN